MKNLLSKLGTAFSTILFVLLQVCIFLFKSIKFVLHPLFKCYAFALNPLRKFIVKNFALTHTTRAFNLEASFVRGAVFIYPAFIITGLLFTYSSVFGVDLWLKWVSLFFMCNFVFMGFFYFDFYPVKFSELDAVQMYSYGKAYEQNIIDASEDDTFNIEHLMYVNKWYEVDLKKMRFYKPFLWLFNPIVSTLLSLLIALIVLVW